MANKTKRKPPKVTELTTADIIQDDKNFNKGSEFGNHLMGKSFQEFGAGRSILLDKNNRIIAGNKSSEKYVEGGGENIIVVETDGKTMVAVKRMDIDLDTEQGRRMALADNASALANIVLDAQVIEAVISDVAVEEWGLGSNKNFGNKNKELKIGDEEKYTIELSFTSADFFRVKEAIALNPAPAEVIMLKALNLE